MAEYPYSTRRWTDRIRPAKLRRNPLCEACLQMGKVEPANVVDHIVPICAGGDPFPPLDELASLCASCHNVKSRAEQLGEKNWFYKGCDINGMPLDPNHPWNRERNSKA